MTIDSLDKYKRWYEKVNKTLFDRKHTIENLEINERNPEAYTAIMQMHFTAKTTAKGQIPAESVDIHARIEECVKNKLSQIVFRFVLDFAVAIEQNHRNSIPISRILRLRRDKM